MTQLLPAIRNFLRNIIDRVGNKSLVAKVFGISRQTVYKWSMRDKYFLDRKRKPRLSKITFDIEAYILALRNTFEWGTARIQQALMCLPEFMKNELRGLTVTVVQEVKLSRQAIQNVLVKHRINGYKNKIKSWKFFRAAKPNELWQLDIKGPFTLQGKKYYFVICIDDYSRFLILAEQLDHCPTCFEIGKLLETRIQERKPLKILTDNNPFRKEWDDWCKSKNIESLHAHLYYPQDKGKVERTIRNISEEFIYLITKFPHWIEGKIKEYTLWFNHKRFHRGVRAKPADLYLSVNLET